MKKTLFTPSVAILAICLAITSCSQQTSQGTSIESSAEQSVEETIEPFTPIEITENYDGPILGIENWHMEFEDLSWGSIAAINTYLIDDDTGKEFAAYGGLDTVIYMGTHDGYGEDPTTFDQVLEIMPSSELVIIDGADHFFEGEYGEMMVDDACAKIASW